MKKGDREESVEPENVINFMSTEPRFPNSNLDGIKGSGFKAYRNHIYWTVDGFGVFTLPGTITNIKGGGGGRETEREERYISPDLLLGSGNPTSVEIAGNFVEAMAYFHGGYYSDINGG